MTKSTIDDSTSNSYEEQTDHMLVVMRPSAWLWLSVCIILAATALAWSIGGRVVSRVPGKGILVHEGGYIINVTAREAGLLVKMLVKPADKVKKGQIVAQLEQPVLKQEMDNCTRDLQLFKTQTIARKPAGAGSEGGPQSLMQAQEQFDLAFLKYKLASDVVAGTDGTVVGILAEPGTLVERYSPIIKMETGGDQLQALLFFPSVYGKKVQPGQLVELSPNAEEASETGFLWGKVTDVSDLPLSRHAMLALVRDDNLVDGWIKDFAAPTSARVEILKDANASPKWSLSRGQDLKVTSGTLIDASIRVREERPLALIFPRISQIFGTQ